MPAWPGPVLAIGGGLLAIVALGSTALIRRGELGGGALVGWLAVVGALAFVAGLVYIALRQLRVRSFLPPERYRGPGVLILTLLVLALAFLLVVPFGADASALVLGEGELTLIGAIVLLVSTQVALLAVSYLLVFRPNALAGLPWLPGRNASAAITSGLGWGVVAWLGATLLAGAVVFVLERLGIEPEPQAAERAIAMLDPWLVILAVVILAPVAEEIFFRGVVFNALRREAGRRWAFIGSAALFAVIHISLVALLPIFVLGLALAWVYERTDNLLAPIAMHAVVNGISVALALLVRFDLVRLPV